MSNLYTSVKTIVIMAVLSLFVSNAQAAVQPTYTPAPGTLYGLENVVLVFSGKTVEVLDESKIYFSNNKEIRIFAGVPMTDQDNLVLEFNKIRTAGTYELVVDAGAISIDGEPNDEAYKATYEIIIGGDWTGNVTVNPNAGTVESLHEFRITYPKANNLSISNSASSKDFPALYKLRKDGSRGEIYQVLASTAINSLILKLIAGEITAPGNYELVIPKNFLDVDGETPTKDFTFKYNIEGYTGEDFDYSYVATPDSKTYTNDMRVFTVEFESISKLEEIGFWPNTPSFLELDDYGRKVGQVGATYRVTETSVVMTLGEYCELEKDGKYKLVIPEAFLRLTSADGTKTMTNDQIEIYYNYNPVTTAISNVVAKGSDGEIYNVAGIKVSAKPESLPAGMYIINGKKTYIK